MTPGREPDEPGGTIDITDSQPVARDRATPGAAEPAHP
jgi:hypothetical protein